MSLLFMCIKKNVNSSKKKYILIIFVDFYVSLSQFFFLLSGSMFPEVNSDPDHRNHGYLIIIWPWRNFIASVVMLILFCPILFWMSLIPWLSQFKQNGIVKIVNYHNFCANCQLQNPLLKSLVSIASFYQNSENLIFMEIMFINNCAIWKEYETKLNS